MRNVSTDQLHSLQHDTDCIRNICIVAHVDHGKTTLADCLISSNGIISSKMAGKLRYMDSRKDEQERGITMKSSSISLYHKNKTSQEYLINLIDSPGHVDFSSEVSTAVRICDGAIVVVDCVEGVCPQTQVALKQAWLENIQPILVLNKIDRLIIEMKLAPLDVYVHLSQILEQVNAVMGELFASQIMDETSSKINKDDSSDNIYTDWGTGLEDADDSDLYFAPDRGNVVFASAIDGWGFSINDFARLYSEKLGIREELLRKTLWGDYYLNMKAKRIMKGAQEKAKSPLFVEFVLKNIWTLYETVAVRKDKEKLQKIVESLNIKLTTRDFRHTDPKVQIQAVMSQWLPLSVSVLDMVCTHCPSPNKLSELKVEKLLSTSHCPFQNLPLKSKNLKSSFLNCSSNEKEPLVIFISKMFPIERKFLPENKQKPLTHEEMTARREAARARLLAKKEEESSIQNSDIEGTPTEPSLQLNQDEEKTDTGQQSIEEEKSDPIIESDDVFIAFARVYSGTVRKGDTVYVLGPKHDPAIILEKLDKGEDLNIENKTLKDLKSGCHVTKVTLNNLYLLMGRELVELDEVPAGNMLGIGGLEDHVLKSATLSSDLLCPSFSELHLMAVPILRVAVEPVIPSDLNSLVKGLRLLNQADACVEVILQETGEHVLVTAGEVHLQRCLDDLRERYAKVQIKASEPIVPFRETIIPPPTLDMMNETIVQPVHQQQDKKEENSNHEEHGYIIMHTQDTSYQFKIQAVPICDKVTELLNNHSELLKSYHRDNQNRKRPAHDSDLVQHLENLEINKEQIENELINKEERDMINNILKLKKDLINSVKEEKEIKSLSESDIENIWSFGPRYHGPNLLINCIEDFKFSAWSHSSSNQSSNDDRYDHVNSVVNGFQMATLSGPLCEEPMMGVGFKILEWKKCETSSTQSTSYGPISGQIMASIKEGCRKTFQAQPQRLMAAMYTCNIQVSSEALGKLYGVLGKRHGRVTYGDMTQGSATFVVQAFLPVVESFNFAPEIRKATSGLASPQLVFSHWEVINIDPFWEPTTEEEYLHFGEKADTENRARKYMDNVRKRKGLHVQEKIVQHAEKQRTFKKNK